MIERVLYSSKLLKYGQQGSVDRYIASNKWAILKEKTQDYYYFNGNTRWQIAKVINAILSKLMLNGEL